MRRRFWFALAAALVGSCTGDDPLSVPTSRPGEDAGLATQVPLIVSVEPLSAVPARTTRARMVIDRRGFAGVGRVVLTGVPAGVDIPAFDLAEGASETEIVVTGSIAATPTRTTVAVELQTGASTARFDVPLVVRGLPGSTDRTRSPSGLHPIPLVPRAAAQDAQGRILTVGGSGDTCRVSRHVPTGEIDPTFGQAGIVTLAVPAGATLLRCAGIAVQADKILLTGSESIPADGGGSEVVGVAMRLGADGALDASFGTGGYVAVPDGIGVGIGSDPQGGVRVGAGRRKDGRLFLARYDASGAFVSASDVVSTEIDDAVWAFGPDGSARAGYRYQPDDDDPFTTTPFAASGFGLDGQIDPAFGPAGTVAPWTTSPLTYAGALAIDAKGRLLMAGTEDNFGLFAYIARFDPTGNPTWTRLSASTHSVPGAKPLVTALASEPDGRIFAVGTRSRDGFASELYAARFLEDGAPDRTFDPSGIVVHPEIPYVPMALLLQADGVVAVLQLPSGGAVLRLWL